ncbi:hypothetical protein NX059_006526 [Plenodomus lindquistii]|nr:hypothetical protein NX059_006526 [Plenodomus lindquistii]
MDTAWPLLPYTTKQQLLRCLHDPSDTLTGSHPPSCYIRHIITCDILQSYNISMAEDSIARQMLDGLRQKAEPLRDRILDKLPGELLYSMLRLCLQDRDTLEVFVQETNIAVMRSKLGEKLGDKLVASSKSEFPITLDDFQIDDDGQPWMVEQEPVAVTAEGKGKEPIQTMVRAGEAGVTVATAQMSSNTGYAEDQDHEDTTVLPSVEKTPPCTSQQSLQIYQGISARPPSTPEEDLFFYSPMTKRHMPLMILHPADGLRPFSDLSKDVRAMICDRFRLICGKSTSRYLMWERIKNVPKRRVDRQTCLRYEIITAKLSKAPAHSPLQDGGVPRMLADDICCDFGAPCAYIAHYKGDYVMYFVPTQEQYRRGAWTDLGFWVNLSVHFGTTLSDAKLLAQSTSDKFYY